MLYNLQMSDLTSMEAMTEHENQKKMLAVLQSRLEEAEQQIMVGEKLRKKLHHTIVVMFRS
jgi:kinesin family member C1